MVTEGRLYRLLESFLRSDEFGPEDLRPLLELTTGHSGVHPFGVLSQDAAEDSWMSRFGQLKLFADIHGTLEVLAAGRKEKVNLSLEDLWLHYIPFCSWLLGKTEGRSERFLTGIVGPPGSGKTVLCELLRFIINRLVGTGDDSCAVLAMDGFHFRNDYLDRNWTVDAAGNQMPLRVFKGMPCSFDLDAFLLALKALPDREAEMSLPVYDRSLHEPVADGLRVLRKHSIVLVEGNFLLDSEDGWAAVRPMLDLTLFIDTDDQSCKERLLKRHVTGGRNEEEGLQHFDRVDRPNFERVRKSAGCADLLLSMDWEGRIKSFRWCD